MTPRPAPPTPAAHRESQSRPRARAAAARRTSGLQGDVACTRGLRRIRASARPRRPIGGARRSLTDMDAFTASRALRDDPHVGAGDPADLDLHPATVVAPTPAASAAGVWEFLRHPFHDEEIAGQARHLCAAEFDSDRARRDASIADRRASTPSRAGAARPRTHAAGVPHAQPLACVALAAVTFDGQNAGVVELLADVLPARVVAPTRSDGRPGEFSRSSRRHDRAGAVKLAERLPAR